ncbi:helix-turn-helix domain-containing protein [Bacillus dakarensis]|uniref:helix-turn-helix domain-containing protein n=1 Tax=Robertmurraya dakarensis TaxID=1926278 RepID=UPI000981DE5B|nr:helix-turn-helix transcriptional regulator [Bacillus dakarensis]
MVSIGDNIKLCRERLNMSQEELALKLRVGPSKIQKYESGEIVPNTDTLLKISTALDTPASVFFDTRMPLMEDTTFEQLH